MPIKIGILSSGEGLELAALIGATINGQLPAEIKIVITDRDSSALALAREAGLYGCFLPRSIFHENQSGFEHRLTELLKEAGAEAIILANFLREPGPTLEAAFPGKIIDLQGLQMEDIPEFVARKLRSLGLSLL